MRGFGARGQFGAPQSGASGGRISYFFEGALSESFGRGPRALRIAPGGSREGSGRGSGSVSGRFRGGARGVEFVFFSMFAFFEKRAPAEAKTLFLRFLGFGKRAHFVQKSVRITQTVRKRDINDPRASLGRLFGALGRASGGPGVDFGRGRASPRGFKNVQKSILGVSWARLGRSVASRGSKIEIL